MQRWNDRTNNVRTTNDQTTNGFFWTTNFWTANATEWITTERLMDWRTNIFLLETKLKIHIYIYLYFFLLELKLKFHIHTLHIQDTCNIAQDACNLAQDACNLAQDARTTYLLPNLTQKMFLLFNWLIFQIICIIGGFLVVHISHSTC